MIVHYNQIRNLRLRWRIWNNWLNSGHLTQVSSEHDFKNYCEWFCCHYYSRNGVIKTTITYFQMLHPWEVPLSVPEFGRPGPQAQNWPLHGPGVPPQSDPEGEPTLMQVTHAAPTIYPQAPIPWGNFLCLLQAAGSQDTDAQARARLMDIRGEILGHQRQGIPPEIPRQVPMSPSQPRSSSVVTTQFGSTKKSNGDRNSGGYPPHITPPPPTLVKEAWHRMQGWYKTASNRPPPPACIELAHFTAELV